MKRLSHLLSELQVLETRGDLGTPVRGVTHDSRTSRGNLFVCIPGFRRDGHVFARQAVRGGARALLVERLLPLSIPQVRVPDTRTALAPVSAAFFGHPSRLLGVVGVTGTNGKTTTTHLLRTIFEGYGWPTGVSGTLSGDLTTPEAPELQARFRGFLASGKRWVTMEVSSHALELRRVDATRFAAAIFTNLDRDHLDFHGSMEAYFRAKARLFEPDRVELAVVNSDDHWGRRLLASADDSTLSYSLSEAENLALDRAGSSFLWQGHQVHLRLPARFNVANALAAATTAHAMGCRRPWSPLP